MNIAQMSLSDMLTQPDAPLWKQKRCPVRPSLQELHHIHSKLNAALGLKVTTPKLSIKRMRMIYGLCVATNPVEIICIPNWPTLRFLLSIMAHEMCHQYQVENNHPMDHDEFFYSFSPRLHSLGLPLCEVYEFPLQVING